MNLFKISTNDASVDYLGSIFGKVSGVITSNNMQFGDINILSTMFKVFNGVVLTVAVLMLIYVTIVGVIGTAHEGEFMGKRWNNIWIPIRAVLGFALLVPTGAGYCGLQILMMWVIVQGIGAADVLWNTALSYIQDMGVYSQVYLPPTTPQSKLPILFQGLACDAATRLAGPKLSAGKYYCTENGTVPCDASPQPFAVKDNVNSFTLGPQNLCGTVTFNDAASLCSGENANSAGCLAAQKQTEAIKTIVPVLSGIAISLAQADLAYRDFYANSGSATTNKGSWSWINGWCSSKGISSNNCCVQTENQREAAQASGVGRICAAVDFPKPDVGTDAQSAGPETVKMYWQYYPQLGPALGTNTSFIGTAVDYYMDALQTAYNNYIIAQGQNQKNMSDDIKAAADKGWILAGAFYYNLASKNNTNFQFFMPSLTVLGPDQTRLNSYRNDSSAASSLIAAIPSQGGDGGGRSNGSNKNQQVKVQIFSNLPSQLQLGQLDDTLSSGLTSINQNTGTDAGKKLVTGTNPLIKLAAAGNTMMWVAGAVYVAIVLTVGLLAIFFNISVFILGNGVTNPLGPGLGIMMMFVLPLIFGIIGLLITMGALLGVYVPLIPFIIFAFGAIHWLISAVETMVAGPLVALGIISPSGQHELLGKAEPALMLLFNVFLRPSLMIFGLIAAMLVASVVQSMIDSGWSVARSMGFTNSPISWFVSQFLYVTLVVSALNKCFNLINLLPAQVMRWIGGQAEAVESPLQEVKGGMEQGAGTTKGGVSGTQESGAATGRDMGESYKETKEGKDQSNKLFAGKDKPDGKGG